MRLKNKIVALALVVASAFGLAVSNHATKVVAADKYVEVTDVNNLANGDTVIIVSKANNKVMSTSGDNKNYRGHENIAFEDDGSIILNSETAYVFTIIVNSDGTYGFDCGNGNYLGLTSTSNQLHLVTDSTSDNAKWTISIGDEGTNIFSKYQTNREIRYNKSNPRFATYKSTEQAIQIFEKDAGTVAPELQIAAIKTQVQLGLIASNYQASEVPLFTPVSSVDNLEDGDKVIIVANNKVMSASGAADNYRGQENVTIEEDSSIILDSVTAYVLKVIINEDGTYGFDCGNGKYLGLTADSNNLHLVSDATADSAKWNISISENLASINPVSYPSRSLNHNASATRFACYNASSNQSLVTIYKKTDTVMGDAAYTYFSDVKLRFVAEIPAELVTSIDADGEFGINIIGETKQQDIELDSEHWVVDEKTGDVSFAVVVKVPNDISKYSVEITGQAYVTVAGQRIDLGAKTYSVNKLVADYLGGVVELNETEVTILEGFQKFVAANS